jgi:hypothetical protein
MLLVDPHDFPNQLYYLLNEEVLPIVLSTHS